MSDKSIPPSFRSQPMTQIEFNCTKCPTKLRVPDVMAGKKIRCPKCQSIEKVPGGVRSKRNDDDFWNQKLPGTSSVNSRDSLGSDDGYALKEPIDPQPDQQRAAGSISYHEARRAVSLPATVLLIISIIVTALNALWLAQFIWHINFAPPAELNAQTALIYMASSAIAIFLSCATLKGINSFRKVRKAGWAWAGLILAMTPFGTSFGCVIAIPFAVWGIVLLCNRRIREHYR